MTRADGTQSLCIVIGQVFPGTLAEAAGLRAGDRIIGVNGQAVRDFADYYTVVGTRAPDGDLIIDIMRDGEVLSLVIGPPRGEPTPVRVGRSMGCTCEVCLARETWQ